MALMLPENAWCWVALLNFFAQETVWPYVITSYFTENSVWKAFTPCDLTCTALSRLVANLVLFWILPTNSPSSIAIFHHTPVGQHDFWCNITSCAITLPVQYHFQCNITSSAIWNLLYYKIVMWKEYYEQHSTQLYHIANIFKTLKFNCTNLYSECGHIIEMAPMHSNIDRCLQMLWNVIRIVGICHVMWNKILW